MEGENNSGNRSIIRKNIAFLILTILIALLAIFIVLKYVAPEGVNNENLASLTESETETANESKVLDFVDNSKFGFLPSGPDDSRVVNAMAEIGALWMRPHPGKFVWSSMQEKAGASYSFHETDGVIKNAQAGNLNLLITLWPYAKWDQKGGADCQVSNSDQFARELPLSRCKPNDWSAYSKWLKAVVERYDGDGVGDMPGLKMPVKYWEIANEPDLTGANLVFFRGAPEDYALLLKNSTTAIREADTNAKVLIAGAAGVTKDFSDYWQKVFAVPEISQSFDVANVHAINGGNLKDLNVSDYQDLLERAKIEKPIWVTEAEGRGQGTNSAKAAELDSYVAKAMSAGVEKIFFTGAALSDNGAISKYDPQNIINDKEFYRPIISKY